MSRAPLIGGVVGLTLAIAIWPSAQGAIDRLDAARAALAEARVERMGVDRAAGAGFRLRTGSAARAEAAAAARARRIAKANGVLVERAAHAAPGGPGLAGVALTLSGPEKAVLAVADSIEREGTGARWRDWRLAGVGGGAVRLSGTVAVAWR